MRLTVSNVIKLVIQGRRRGSARIFKKRFRKNIQRLGSKNRRRELRQKKIWRRGSARGSVAGRNTVIGDFRPWSGAARADRKQLSPEEWEWVGGRVAQEGAAGKDSVGKIDMAFVFGWVLRCVYCPGGGLSEIEDEETGEDLLEDEVRLLCVKMDEAHGILQAAEGGLDAPAPGVEGCEGREVKTVRGQVGDQGFHIAAVGL